MPDNRDLDDGNLGRWSYQCRGDRKCAFPATTPPTLELVDDTCCQVMGPPTTMLPNKGPRTMFIADDGAAFYAYH